MVAHGLKFSAQVLSSQEVLYEIRFAVLHITSGIFENEDEVDSYGNLVS